MSFGIGIGAFADGFMRGVGMGKTLKGVRKENEADKVREGLMKEAAQARNEQIEAETARLMSGGGTAQAQGAEQIPVQGQAQAFPVDMGNGAPAVQQAVPAQPLQAAAPVTVPGTEVAPAPPTVASQGIAPQTAAPVPVSPSVFEGGINPPGGMTEEEARNIAKKKSSTVVEIFKKNGVPKMEELYLSQGDPEKAAAWRAWANQDDSQKAMESWAKAWRATQLDDIEGAANHFFELYKAMDDSVTLSGKETVKDKDGNITGFNVNMRDKETGEKRAVFVDRERLINTGLSALAPTQLFEAVWSRETAAEKARTDAAAEVGKITMQAQKELMVEGARQQGRVALEDHKAQMPGPLGTKIADMRREGASQEQIQGVLNAAAMADDAFKKGASPQETKRQLITNLSKQYVDYAGRPTKTPAEIAAEADEFVTHIFGGSGAPGGAAMPAPANVGNLGEAARGLPPRP